MIIDPETTQVATPKPAVTVVRTIVVLVLTGLSILVLLPALLAVQAASGI